MRVIAVRDLGVEIFNDADIIEQEDPSWITIDGEGDIRGDMFIVFREQY
jgi:hypothetical protein